MIRLIIYIIIIALHTLLAATENLKTCVLDDARKLQCSQTEMCVISVCTCLPGYERVNNICTNVIPSPSVPSPAPFGPAPAEKASQHNVAVAIVIPLLLVSVVVGAVVLVRRFNIVIWIRNKLNQRETPYDEVMIGQDDDDPPIGV